MTLIVEFSVEAKSSVETRVARTLVDGVFGRRCDFAVVACVSRKAATFIVEFSVNADGIVEARMADALVVRVAVSFRRYLAVQTTVSWTTLACVLPIPVETVSGVLARIAPALVDLIQRRWRSCSSTLRGHCIASYK